MWQTHAIVLHLIVEPLPQSLHSISFPTSPFLLGTLSPFLIVSLDPHLVQINGLSSIALDSCTSERTGVFIEKASRAFSEGCFVSFVMLPVAVWGIVADCAIAAAFNS